MEAPNPVRLLGLEMADLTLEDAARWIDARPPGAPFGYVVTPNADHLVRLSRDARLRSVYGTALLSLLDSRVVATAARLVGLPAPNVVTGSDLTERLLTSLPANERVTIVGLGADRLAALCRRCGLASPAHYDPPRGFEHDPAAIRDAVRFVLDHPARLVFIAVGSPRQERLAAAIQAEAGATGTGLCIGASLDFLAGAARRAPIWMQRAGLEWLHRLAGDPRRLARRYLRDDPPVFALLMRERWRTRRATATLRPARP